MKIFVSYTMRDKEITRSMLKAFSSKLTPFGKTFIDLLDNNSEEKQKRVIYELDTSDLFLLIESSETFLSSWVQFELERANLKGIKTHSIHYSHLMDSLDSKLLFNNLSILDPRDSIFIAPITDTLI